MTGMLGWRAMVWLAYRKRSRTAARPVRETWLYGNPENQCTPRTAKIEPTTIGPDLVLSLLGRSEHARKALARLGTDGTHAPSS